LISVGSEVQVLPGPPLVLVKSGDVAQLVEHLLCKQGVVGSIPSISTMILVWSDAVTGGIQVSMFWCLTIPEKVCGEQKIGCLLPRLSCLGAEMFFVRVNRFWCIWVRVLE
jgi:hypothetical protein